MHNISNTITNNKSNYGILNFVQLGQSISLSIRTVVLEQMWPALHNSPVTVRKI